MSHLCYKCNILSGVAVLDYMVEFIQKHICTREAGGKGRGAWIRLSGKDERESIMEMEKRKEAEKIMEERFGKDSLIALATEAEGIPYVRPVNSYYRDGSFYVITYALSGKMLQIRKNDKVAVCGEWFNGHGIGINRGWFSKPENAETARWLREAFAEWIDNGHNNFEDENCIILQIRLTDGVLLSHGTRYELDYAE